MHYTATRVVPLPVNFALALRLKRHDDFRLQCAPDSLLISYSSAGRRSRWPMTIMWHLYHQRSVPQVQAAVNIWEKVQEIVTLWEVVRVGYGFCSYRFPLRPIERHHV